MAITNSFLYMIAANTMPLQTPENRGFRKFTTTACPLYKPHYYSEELLYKLNTS